MSIKTKQFCFINRANNYWADFVDPASGRAYFGSNATMTETSDNYEPLRFAIDDLGCCKVVTHSQFNSSVFVGHVVTNASVTDDVIAKLLKTVEIKKR